VSPGAWYVGGLGLAASLGGVVLSMAAPGIRTELLGGMAIGFLVQAPLGWWHVRTLGTGRFQLVWGAGMLLRLLSVGVTALILVPIFRWQLAPTLGALLGSIAILLFVEVLAVMRKSSGINA
jgi:mannitol-specific phosphotransferase system IIBC component